MSGAKLARHVTRVQQDAGLPQRMMWNRSARPSGLAATSSGCAIRQSLRPGALDSPHYYESSGHATAGWTVTS
jgi:hypothetical protein